MAKDKPVLEIENVVSFTEAANILGVSRQAMHYFVNQGILVKVDISGRNYLMRSEVLSLKAEREK